MAQLTYIVSALKHRPSTFAEVLAQDHVTQTLKNSLARNQIANAYLFAGPRGTGKTTTARILAKALNCEDRQDSEPCNRCDSCLAVNRGTHPDVLEIDAASNTGVDHIRELRQNVRFSPSMSAYKIYIIDEVHMLSKSAENAFLKTLEEPPSHCCFIMATTELHKLLPTILSRCQRYQLRRIPNQIIVDHLRRIVSLDETLEIADPAEIERILFLIARASEGGLRDALFSLDQLLAFCSGKLNLAEVEEILGAIEFDVVDRYIRAILQENYQTIVETVESITNQGKDIGLFFKECMMTLRNLAVIKVSKKNLALLELPEDYSKQLIETAELTTLEQILYITDMFWDAEYRIRHSAMARMIFEMASIKAAKAGQAVKIESLIKKLSSGGPIQIQVLNAAPSLPPQPVQSPPPRPAPEPEPQTAPPLSSSEPQAPQTDSAEPAGWKPAPQVPQSDAESAAEPAAVPLTPSADSLSSMWNKFLHDIEERDPVIRAALENAVPLELDGDTIRTAFPSTKKFHLGQLNKPVNQKKLKQYIEKSFGGNYRIVYEVRDDCTAPQNTDAVEAAPPSAQMQQLKKELFDKVQNDKIFIKLQEELPGQIVDVKPEVTT